jgi:hypothetical protein
VPLVLFKVNDILKVAGSTQSFPVSPTRMTFTPTGEYSLPPVGKNVTLRLLVMYDAPGFNLNDNPSIK